MTPDQDQPPAGALSAEVACSEFTLRDFTGRQPDEIVIGERRAELRAMTLMLWYPESRFQIIPNSSISGETAALSPDPNRE